jgi:hypothetical protein
MGLHASCNLSAKSVRLSRYQQRNMVEFDPASNINEANELLRTNRKYFELNYASNWAESLLLNQLSEIVANMLCMCRVQSNSVNLVRFVSK